MYKPFRSRIWLVLLNQQTDRFYKTFGNTVRIISAASRCAIRDAKLRVVLVHCGESDETTFWNPMANLEIQRLWYHHNTMISAKLTREEIGKIGKSCWYSVIGYDQVTHSAFRLSHSPTIPQALRSSYTWEPSPSATSHHKYLISTSKVELLQGIIWWQPTRGTTDLKGDNSSLQNSKFQSWKISSNIYTGQG